MCCWRVSSGTDYKSNLRARGLQAAEQKSPDDGSALYREGSSSDTGLDGRCWGLTRIRKNERRKRILCGRVRTGSWETGLLGRTWPVPFACVAHKVLLPGSLRLISIE